MITPEDIESVEFSKSVRGYNDNEVDDFLDELSADMKTLIEENMNLKKELEESAENCRRLDSELTLLREKMSSEAEIKREDDSLLNTLESARDLIKQINESAQQRANQIIENANVQAAGIVSKARIDILNAKKEEDILKERVVAAKCRFAALLEAELKCIYAIDKDVFGADVKDDFEKMMDSINEE